MPKLSLAFDILADDAKARRTLDRLGDKSEKTGKRIGKSFALLGGTIVGAFAGISAVRLFQDFNSEAREAQKMGRLTAQVIKTTGKAAHVSQKQVEALASAISEKAGIDDEAVQSAENLLLTFTDVRNEVGKGNKIFDRATRIVVDMSTALGTDFKGSAVQVGKALNDPIKGITALTRVGVSFTGQQKKQIKALVESGDKLGAQKIILKELGREFGGAAEAAATPMDKLKVKIGNLEETIGTKLIPIEDKAATFLLDKGIPAIERFAQGFQDGVGPGGEFADALGDVKDGLETAWHVGKPFLTFVADHPRLFTELAVGAGAFATAMKVIGGVKKLPGLGGLVSKAAPLPVFVTNPGFGTPGVPGAPKGKTVPPVVPAASRLGLGVGVVGTVLLTSGDAGPASDAQKQNKEWALALRGLADSRNEWDKAARDLFNKATGITFDTSDSKNRNRVAQHDLVAAYDFLVKYGNKSEETQKRIAALAKDPAVAQALKLRVREVTDASADAVKLISGGFVTLKDLAKTTGTQAGVSLGGGISLAKDRVDALNTSLQQVKAPIKGGTDGTAEFSRGLTTAKDRVDEVRSRLMGLKPPIDDSKRETQQLLATLGYISKSNPRVNISGIDPAVQKANELFRRLERIDGTRVRARVDIQVASGQTSLRAAERALKINSASGNFLSPYQASWVGERGRELWVPDVPGRVLSHQDSMRAVQGSSGLSMTNYITVADNKTAMRAPDQLAAKMFAMGFYR